MNHRSDIDRVMQVWMADGPTAIPDRVVDVIAARIGVQRQRRAWPFPRRTIMTRFKLAAGLAAAIVVAVVAWQLLPGMGGVGGQPTPIPSPTAIPTSTPAATGPVALPNGILSAGSYRVQPVSDPATLSVTMDVPAGWVGYPANVALASPGSSNEGIVIGFLKADGLFSDPCQWDMDGTGAYDQPGDVEIGPTVDDLVAALQANSSYTSSTPSSVTFGEFQGSELELQLPGDDVLSTCDREPGGEPKGLFYVFSGKEAGWYAQGPDNRFRLTIVDVDGTRLIVMINYFEASPQADLEAARAIVESFEFTP
ncbi:MAG: hypothetical protein AABZ33_03575 [Chloroflexota bacterium]